MHQRSKIYRLLLALFLVVIITSCDRGPVPDISWLPEMVDVSVEPGVDAAVLSAKVKGEVQYGCEYGFYYGTTETELQKIQSPCQDGVVSTTLKALLPDTKYLFKAYVTNGRVETCSHTLVFKTLQENNLPAEPDLPSEPAEPDAPSEPAEPDAPSGQEPDPVPEPDQPITPDNPDISEEYIVFADAQVKSACVEALDDNSDGEVSFREAAALTDLNAIALKGKSISSFDEFQYFTSVSTVPYEYFKNSYLESIKLPPSLETIGESSFAYCLCLTEIEIPASVKEIEKFAFCYCSNLKRVTLPESLNNIQQQAFRSCYALWQINIPQSLTELSDWLFYQCRSLSSITLPENLLYIRSGVFEDCDALTEVTVPSEVKVIGDNAFSDCESLERVFVRPLVPPVLGLTPFNDNHPSRLLYVPSESMDAYNEHWTSYKASLRTSK